MNSFARLGLDAEADERAVKRAYAALLKKTRPDEDPQGFQTLHEAYQSALALCRQHVTKSVVHNLTAAPALADVETTFSLAEARDQSEPKEHDAAFAPTSAVLVAWEDVPEPVPVAPAKPVVVTWDIPDVAVPATQSAIAASPVRENFDFVHFFGRIAALATAGDADAVRTALASEPAFWSLEAKALAGHCLIDAIEEHEPPMPAECFDALLAFFDLDHVLAGLDPLAMDRLRRRCRLRWELLPQGAEALALRVRASLQHVPDVPRTQRLLADLKRPFRWRAALRSALPPGAPAEHADFIARLSKGDSSTLPPPIESAQVDFWLAAADRSCMSRPRLALVGARILAACLIGTLIGSVLGLLTRDVGLTVVFIAVPFALGLVWLIWIGWQALLEWQARPQFADTAGRHRWLRLGFVPALGAIGIAAKYFVAPPAGAALVMLAIFVAIARYRRRAHSPTFNYYSWRVTLPLLLLFKIVKVITADKMAVSYFIEFGAATALAIWAADLWKQRAHLRPAG